MGKPNINKRVQNSIDKMCPFKRVSKVQYDGVKKFKFHENESKTPNIQLFAQHLPTLYDSSNPEEQELYRF